MFAGQIITKLYVMSYMYSFTWIVRIFSHPQCYDRINDERRNEIKEQSDSLVVLPCDVISDTSVHLATCK